MADIPDCWRGKGDQAPFVPGRPERIPRAASLGALFRSMACCTRCELATGRTQVVAGVGAPHARVMFIGEAPGAEEDRRGEPFVGAAGRLFNRLLKENGFSRDEVFITNVVACRPPGNRTPRAREVRAHSPWLEEQLRLVDPDVLVTLGRIALTYFLPRAKVTEVRGRPQEVERNGRVIPLLPLLHPAAILRNREELLPRMETDFARLRPLLAAARSTLRASGAGSGAGPSIARRGSRRAHDA
ncbi:MAG: uracil-DNA glycosylase [Gemmatimonadetes bacterium]|nr:uracil-DNA glycosylase [Gemmatimonadota bacterium]